MARRRMALLGLATMLAFAACGEAKYDYVSNNSEQLYFKVPRDWELYRLTESDRDGRLPAGFPDTFQEVWRVAFDASEQPDPANVVALDSLPPGELSRPVGQARVFSVNGSGTQQLSLATARSLAFGGIDPLDLPEDLRNLVEVVDYQPIDERNGLVGSRVVVNVRNADEPWQTVDLTTMYDTGKGRLYVFTVGCSADCFEQHKDSIFEVTNSWKVDA